MFFEVKTALLEKVCQFSPKNLYVVTNAHLPATSEFVSIGSPEQKPFSTKLTKILERLTLWMYFL